MVQERQPELFNKVHDLLDFKQGGYRCIMINEHIMLVRAGRDEHLKYENNLPNRMNLRC